MSLYIIAILIGLLLPVGGYVISRSWLNSSLKVKWLITAVVLSIGGALLAAYQANSLTEFWQRRSWNKTEGTVLTARVVGDRASLPEVVYRFVVNDTVHVDTTDLEAPAFGGKKKKYDTAKQIIASYAPGSSVTVHYNPSDPLQSVLSAGVPWYVYARLAFGTTVSLVVFVMVTIPRRRKE